MVKISQEDLPKRPNIHYLGSKTYKGYTSQLATCVRLLRGDFCGTGTPYTVDGTTLNLFDKVGVQADTEVWYPEAEWATDGARCVNSSNTARLDFVVSRDPWCVKPLVKKDCGFSFGPGTVLIDELPGTYQTSSTATTTMTTAKAPAPPM